ATVGALANLYIVIVLLRDYFQTATMSSSDKLLVVLCLANVYYGFYSAVFLLTGSLLPWIYADINIIGIFITLLTFGAASCAWITASLCFFYFIKIINFSSGPLAWMKMKINIIVPWLIVLSEVVALGCSLLTRLPSVIKVIYYNYSLGVYTAVVHPVNVTLPADVTPVGYMGICAIAFFLPLLIMLVTTFANGGSLFLHIRIMEKNMGTSSSLSAHQSVVGTMTFLLSLNTAMLASMILFFLRIFSPLTFGYWMILIIIYSYPLVKSIILFLGNPKLKEALMKRCHCFVGCTK
ncbi:hypothetical protein GDO86_020493, partial [Hymenochirus boettgeri]